VAEGNKDFAKALEYLNGFTNFERKTGYKADSQTLGLSRIRNILNRLGDPHTDLPFIHIAGTKGKGSTAHITAAILQEYGYKTGLYTSPHLIDIRERICISGKPISEKDFCSTLKRVKAAANAMLKEDGEEATYFEIITAMAFLHFKTEAVDLAILETGLGGRFDATNVVRPIVCAITRLDIDHTKQLGNTIDKIAFEKCGIIKENITVFSAEQEEKAANVIRKIAKERNAPLFFVNSDELNYSQVSHKAELQNFDFKGPSRSIKNINLSLLGKHQIENATLAIALANYTKSNLFTPVFKEEVVKSALKKISIPARIQVLQKNPVVIFDGAHNPASVKALLKTLDEAFPNVKQKTFVIAIAQDKDYKLMLELIRKSADNIILTSFDNERCCPTAALSDALGKRTKNKTIIESPSAAYSYALGKAGKNDLICITGSLYLAGEVLLEISQKKNK
jgi:dihydrofolate synthase/folylpolyglutamate synthase